MLTWNKRRTSNMYKLMFWKMRKMLPVHWIYAVLALVCILPLATSDEKRMAMKVVEEPTNYGMNFGYGYNQPAPASNTLHLRVQPSNFSGPPHLRRLIGKCFKKVEDSYKYELCPFHNVTQHEQSLRWNPYSGVLGIWQEWEIANNTFVAMLMREGDSCGSVFRSMRVLFECGTEHGIEQVSEPDTCQYQMTFRSPLVCHPHAMLVYPTLSPELQREWDLLEGRLQGGEITQQGYRKFVHRQVFQKAGYVMAESEKSALSQKAIEQEKQVEREQRGEFDSLDKCTQEYKKQKEEIDALRALLELHGIPEGGENSDPDPQHADPDMDYDMHRMMIEDTDDDY